MHKIISNIIFNPSDRGLLKVEETCAGIQMEIPLTHNGKMRMMCKKEKKICGCEPNSKRPVLSCACENPDMCFISHYESNFTPLAIHESLSTACNGFIKHYLGDDGGVAIGIYTFHDWALNALHFAYESDRCELKTEKICRDVVFSGDVEYSLIEANPNLKGEK